MSRRRILLHAGLALAMLAIVAGLGTYILGDWKSREHMATTANTRAEPIRLANPPVRCSLEARKNMGLSVKPLQVTDYFRTLELPGMITDRPGVSDRGVVAPITGIVTRIHAFPGNIVVPQAPLITLRLTSESLHTSQLELFKATKEIEIAQKQKDRLDSLAQSGGLAGARLIDIDNQIQRMNVHVQAYRQDLLSHGLSENLVSAAARGEFVTEIVVKAPEEQVPRSPETAISKGVGDDPRTLPFSFELQRLKVELGQQVEAGEILCYLADYRELLIEARGFRKDLALVQQAAQQDLPVRVSLDVVEGIEWPALPERFKIEHVGNVIDPVSRTFAFYLPLKNQSRSYRQGGQEHLVWRFRPGDRVRLFVAVRKMEDVFVLPLAGVAREGPEAFVFRQNGDLFDRIGVHVIHEDSTSVIIANDGKLKTGMYIAQCSAAALNRVLKAQLASGQPTNVHVHADGTTHEAH